MTDQNKSEKIGDYVSIIQRGTAWYANYQFSGRQVRVSLKTRNKKTAVNKARELDRKLVEGQSPTKIKPATISDVIQAYKDRAVAENLSKKTKAKYWGVLDKVSNLAIEMSRSSILQLDLVFIDKYRLRRAKCCKPITVYHETVIIRQMVKFAATRKMTPEDPLRGLRLNRPKPTPQPYFNDAQIQQILSHSRPPHDATFLLLAETGLRIGEAQWLTWNDVDFNTNVIHVRAKPGWRPKTGDERAVPMTAKLRAFLKARKRHGEWVLTVLPTKKYPSLDRQIDESRALRSLKRILKPLKLQGKLHSFRHSFVSRCCILGIEEPLIRSWLGHLDPDILRLYTHISSQISQERIRRLGAAGKSKSDESDEGNPQGAEDAA